MAESQKNGLLKCPINEDNAQGNIKPLPNKKPSAKIKKDIIKIYNGLDDVCVCEKCFKKSQYVRFEGLTECNICDKCLSDIKENLI